MVRTDSKAPAGHLLTLVLVLVYAAQSRYVQGLALNKTGANSFEVYVGNITVFHHTEQQPMIFGGQGHTDFMESKGNFKINDYVTSRLPLSQTEFLGTGNIIKLSAGSSQYVKFELVEKDSQSLVLDVHEMAGFDRLWLRVVAERDERVYGGGEQFSYFNLRGQAYPIWTREQGVGRNKSTLETFYSDLDSGAGGDYHTTYFPQPTFVSSRGYYLHHWGSNYAVLDFTHHAFHEVLVLGTPGQVHVHSAPDLTSLVGDLTQMLGRQPPLPDWIHSGAILGVQGGTQMMLDYIQQAEEHGVKVAGVWIQDWVGRITTSFGRRLFWDWHWNQEQYPDLQKSIEDLKKRGIRVLTYINPYLNFEGDLFKEADRLGYFIKNATNQTFVNDFGEFYCGTIDLTNPAAYNWYKNEVVKKNMIQLGFGGWMADFGEYLPTHGVFFHSGQSAEELHNQWPVIWARLNREAVEEAGKLGEIVFWMRAGWTGSGNYSTLMWAGDQNVDWSLSDGLASTVTAALSMGMSGAALTHYDIGGFTTFAAFSPPLVRTEELLLRSAEMAVFTPVFRTHEGNQPSANVQFYSSEGTLKKFARLSRMFAAMTNYTKHVVMTSSTTGLPAQRPLFLSFPSDDKSYDVKYQYTYGEDVLVAPVYLPGVDSWDVYLPPVSEAASWVFLWNETITSRGAETVTVDSPLGQPPVFYRKSSRFVGVFRQLTEEPLVDLPAFVPDSHRDPCKDSAVGSASRFIVGSLVATASVLALSSCIHT